MLDKWDAGDVKTVQASSIDKQDISYDSQAVFANATVYFDFDKTKSSLKEVRSYIWLDLIMINIFLYVYLILNF